MRLLSTHECGVKIAGLPTVLTGHIIPELPIALLFGIRVIMEAGCKVRFNKFKCIIWYNNKIIFEGGKDKATDLWTLPIGSPSTSTHCNAFAILPAAPVMANARAHFATTQIAFFTHTVRNKANSIHFAHQSLCNPHILTLLKAIHQGYIKGCPNLTTKGVTMYLNPSPASAKGHMKCPQQGLCSTQCTIPPADNAPAPILSL
jgi:hypothetical protein